MKQLVEIRQNPKSLSQFNLVDALKGITGGGTTVDYTAGGGSEGGSGFPVDFNIKVHPLTLQRIQDSAIIISSGIVIGSVVNGVLTYMAAGRK